MNDDNSRVLDSIEQAAPMPVQATATVPAVRRRVWPWVVAGLVLLFLLIAGGLGAGLLALADSPPYGLHVTLDGNNWDGWEGWDDSNGWSAWNGWNGWHAPSGHGLWALLAVGAALLLAMVVVAVVVTLVVPLALLVALAMAGLGLGLALAAGLGSAALVLLVVGSPLWLALGLLWLLWLLLRRRSPAAVLAMPPTARMGA